MALSWNSRHFCESFQAWKGLFAALKTAKSIARIVHSSCLCSFCCHWKLWMDAAQNESKRCWAITQTFTRVQAKSSSKKSVNRAPISLNLRGNQEYFVAHSNIFIAKLQLRSQLDLRDMATKQTEVLKCQKNKGTVLSWGSKSAINYFLWVTISTMYRRAMMTLGR